MATKEKRERPCSPSQDNFGRKEKNPTEHDTYEVTDLADTHFDTKSHVKTL